MGWWGNGLYDGDSILDSMSYLAKEDILANGFFSIDSDNGDDSGLKLALVSNDIVDLLNDTLNPGKNPSSNLTGKNLEQALKKLDKKIISLLKNKFNLEKIKQIDPSIYATVENFSEKTQILIDYAIHRNLKIKEPKNIYAIYTYSLSYFYDTMLPTYNEPDKRKQALDSLRIKIDKITENIKTEDKIIIISELNSCLQLAQKHQRISNYNSIKEELVRLEKKFLEENLKESKKTNKLKV